ncbi:MAG: aldehyde ferredoxin oxidoreductase [archaeon]|nr:aldehyde ferredoxin oxidoreductase [archaeon]
MLNLFRINLTSKEIIKQSIHEGHPLEFYAGRSLSSKIIATEVPPKSNALGSENKLIFALGFLSGTKAPSSGRISIGAKSPLTKGIKESNVGGRAPTMLSKYNIRGLIFEKQSSDWVIIKISEDNLNLVEILDGNKYLGLDNYELAQNLISDFGKKIGIFSIGTAGEELFANATVASIDLEGYPSRHAGRGGMGAVMGSKKIKAIIIMPSKNKIQIKNENNFNKISKEWFQQRYDATRTFSKYGTALMIDLMSRLNGLPTQNFRRGSFKDADKISGEALHEFITKNNGKYSVGCSPGCPIRCSHIMNSSDGVHITSGLEYETIGLNGSNLMINDIEKIGWIDHYNDDIGIDSIEMGNCLAMFMENGKLKWGDANGVIELIKGIKQKNEDSMLLGLGCYKLGKKLGVSRIPHVKGQGFPAYEPRTFKAMGVTLCTSPQGADHTAGPAIANRKAYANKDYGNLESPEKKILLSKELQIFIMIIDSMGLCYFLGPSYENTKKIALLLKARYGNRWEKTAEDWIEWSKSCLREENDFNIKAGISEKENVLPNFILEEEVGISNKKWDLNQKEIDEFWINF